jgi:phosphoribosylaminoimidazole carboxylase PurE protein
MVERVQKQKLKKRAAKNTPIRVGVVMGSESDLPVMKGALTVLETFGVSHEVRIVSAHRTPDEMRTYAKVALKRGLQVLIAGAGGAAHLPGMLASFGLLPVIGVPVPHGPLEGEDALLSIVQMPRGVPVATVAIGNSENAGYLAVQFLAFGGKSGDRTLQKKWSDHKKQLRKKVLKGAKLK